MQSARRIGFALIGCMAITAAILGHGILSTRKIEGDVRRTSAHVAQAYEQLARDTIPALLEEQTITPAQRNTARDALQHAQRATTRDDWRATIDDVVEARMALRDLVQSFSASQRDASGPARRLHEAFGEASELLAVLEAYNLAAKAWNGNAQSAVASLAATLLQRNASPLPLLRFDGQQEATSTIEL